MPRKSRGEIMRISPNLATCIKRFNTDYKIKSNVLASNYIYDIFIKNQVKEFEKTIKGRL